MPWMHIPRHCQPPEVSNLATGSSRTGWPSGREGEGKVGFQWAGRGLLGKGLAVTPVSPQGDPGPPGKPVSDAAQRVHLCLPQPQDRQPWAVPSMVSLLPPQAPSVAGVRGEKVTPAQLCPPPSGHGHVLGRGSAQLGNELHSWARPGPRPGCPQLQWGKKWVVWGADFVCSRVTEVSQDQKDLLAPRVTQEIKVLV